MSGEMSSLRTHPYSVKVVMMEDTFSHPDRLGSTAEEAKNLGVHRRRSKYSSTSEPVSRVEL